VADAAYKFLFLCHRFTGYIKSLNLWLFNNGIPLVDQLNGQEVYRLLNELKMIK